MSILSIASGLMVLLTVVPSYVISYIGIRASKMGFMAGIQLGLSFFVATPLLVGTLFGQIPQPDLNINEYTPLADVQVTTLIFCFSAIINTMVVLRLHWLTTIKSVASRSHPSTMLSPGIAVFALLLIYALLRSSILYMSGLALGGHWIESYSSLYGENPLAVALGNFLNVFRVAVPATLVFAVERKSLSKKSLFLIILPFTLVEVILSGNRIMLFLSFVAFVIVFRDRLRLVVLSSLVIAPAVLPLNNVYPIIRSMMWTDGLSVRNFLSSYQTATDARTTTNDALVNILSSATEAANLNMLKYVYDNFPSSHDYLAGETVFIKSVTFFLPKAVWPDKPLAFSSILGRMAAGSEFLALNSTLLGEGYGNFGYLCLVITPLLLLAMDALFFCLAKINPLVSIVAFFEALATWRFDFPFAVTAAFCCTTLVCILLALALGRLIKPVPQRLEA